MNRQKIMNHTTKIFHVLFSGSTCLFLNSVQIKTSVQVKKGRKKKGGRMGKREQRNGGRKEL